MGANAHTDLVRAGLAFLRLEGVVCWGNNTGMLYDKRGRPVRYGCTGSADIIGVLPGGRFCGFEAKTGSATPSTAQQSWLCAINEAGGMARVFRNLDDLERFVTEVDHGETTDDG